MDGTQGATSINYMSEKLKKLFAEEQKIITQKRFILPFGYNDFCKLMVQHAQIIFVRRGEQTKFLLDDNVDGMLKLLYQYATQSNAFEQSGYSLRKGIILVGKYGCGKSVIMEAYANVLRDYAEYNGLPMCRFIKAIDLFEELKTGGTKAHARRPLIIDEMGREPKKYSNYGQDTMPVIDLLFERYDTGAITHGTSNFKLETLSGDDYYGRMIGDRMKSMFNFIEMKGDSRRR